MTRMSPILFRTLRALATAGKWTVIFALIFFIFLFATILMVGDGSAPSITNLSSAIVEQTIKFLGIASEGSVFSVVLFWSFVVYVFAFLYALILSSVPADENQKTKNQKTIKYAVFSIVALVAASLILMAEHQNHTNMEDEKMLALDFVTHSDQVINLAGGPVEANISQLADGRGNKGRYEFSVALYGKEKSDANLITLFVDVSRSSGKPTFTIACHLTQDQDVYRDAYKDPCKQ